MSWLRTSCSACLFLMVVPAAAQTTIPATSADWILETIASGQLGLSAAPAGDVNNDGYDDVVIGTRDRIDLYLGSALGLATAPSWSFAPVGALFLRGYPVGDVNADGFDDVLIGEPTYDGLFFESGRVLLFPGSASGLSLNPAWSITGDRAGAQLGEYAGGGDINGDGYDDVAVLETDRIRIFQGSATGPDTIPSWTIAAPTEYGLFVGFRSSRLAIQDLDGDGFADLANTSSESRGNSLVGRLFVYSGSAAGPQLARVINLDYDKGHRLATAFTAGDVNGDGRGDLVLTFFSGFFNPEPGLDDPETVLIFEGSRSVIRPTGRVLLDGIPSDALQHTGSAGDLNNDGYGDLIVAESFEPLNGPSYHRVQLFTGGRNGPGDTPAAIIVPGQPGDLGSFWASTGRAGDVNGDGYDDVMVGVPFYGGVASGTGRVYIFNGRSSF